MKLPFADYIATHSAEQMLAQKEVSIGEDIVNGNLVIAVMDRGWVFVGIITHLMNGKVRIDCCHNVHRWGTAEGLGELAEKGPLKETILYKSGPITGTPIFLMRANEKVWM
jgi:hypothetical protein